MYNKLYKINPAAFLVRLSGIIALLTIPSRTISANIYKWLPFNPYHLAHLSVLVVGLSLIFLASQLQRKRRTAFIATVIIFCILIASEIIHHKDLYFILLYSAVLVFLISQRRQYVVKSDQVSLRRNFAIAGILILAIISFALFTFERIDQYEYGRDLTNTQTLHITVNAMLGDPLPASLHPTRKDYGLLFSLQAASVSAAVIVLAGLFYPIKLRRASSGWRRHRAEYLLTKFGRSSEDYLKLWPHDKHYFFYRDSFVAYGVKNGVAIIIDGATGDPDDFNELRQAFLDECKINSWQIAVLHADETEKQAWEKLALNSLYLGSEARVDIKQFCKTKIGDKHFRYIKNKAAKDGLIVKQVSMPINENDMKQLKAVSEAWLSSGRREYQFLMGYFDEYYLNQCQVFAVYQNDKIIAYTNLLPTFGGTDSSIDHMRFAKGVSPATMHFLLMNLIAQLGNDGQETLNLGLAPLSKIDQNTSKFTKSLLTTIRRLGGRYYSFSGLEQFKNKFEPSWEATYLLYNKKTNLAAIGTAVSGISSFKNTKKDRRWLLLLALLAGLFYASFPIATFFNPAHAWVGLVSLLGQQGQPFAWVFNWLDVSSSVIVICLSYYILRSRKNIDNLLVLGLRILLVSSIGSIVAAIFELPPGFVIHYNLSILQNNNVLLHALGSAINSGGYIIAVSLWSVWSYKKIGLNERHILFAVVLLLFVIGNIIGHIYPTTGDFAQRAFIAFYGVWLVWFVYDIIYSSQKDLG